MERVLGFLASRERVLGFLVPATFLALLVAWVGDFPSLIYGVLFWLTIGYWIFFVIRDRRRRISSA
jgi:hypothetical protein